ncbi:MAG: signal transduction histidine kinase/DNA-binding response OmpR family regulator [Myxococcota bacterium]
MDVIQLLLVEDSEDDAGLILASLRRFGLKVSHVRVETEGGLRDQLNSAEWDVVISDFALPSFDGLRAAAMVRSHDPELPVVLLSGVLGEERAIQAMRAGVRDFIDKSALVRLGVVIEREIREARQRRVAMDELSSARAHARSIVQTLPVPLVIFDESLHVVMTNPSFQAAYTGGELAQGWSASGFPFCVEGSSIHRRLKNLVEIGRAFSGVEVVLHAPREQVLVLSGERLAGPGSMALITLQDITVQREMERQLAARERLESMGRLAGGIAHDFNNILCVIQGYATLIREAATGKQVRNATRISEAVERASRLTSQLLSFSRQEPLTLQLIDLKTVVGSMRAMLEGALEAPITLKMDLGGKPAMVRANLSRLEQVVMNLVLNARDAMPDGGDLTVSLRSEQEQAQLVVEDTGGGMTAETQSRLFEPFFTTRASGTGLGLATVHGIIERLGGQVAVESTLGVGSRFTVTLPRLLAVEEKNPNGATILLVEDEEELLEITQRMLLRRGFRVLTATSGEEALSIFSEKGSSIDLLLTDVSMSGMSGFELASQLKEQCPTLPVMLISGFYQNSNQIPHQVEGALFIRKPFTWAVFLDQIEALLSSDA